MNWQERQEQLLTDLISEVKDTQMTYVEYKFISDLIHSFEAPNCLIFGTGHDSKLWLESNTKGRTTFLEPDRFWVEHSKKHNPDIDVRHIQYITHPGEALDLYFEYEKTGMFPKMPEVDTDILQTEWDVIFVDSPVGAVNGRMTSIYLASELSRKIDKDVHIFLHDSHRSIEMLYSRLFLFPNAKKVENYNYATNEFTLLNYYVR